MNGKKLLRKIKFTLIIFILPKKNYFSTIDWRYPCYKQKKKALNSLKYMFNLFLKIGEDDSPVQDKKK